MNIWCVRAGSGEHADKFRDGEFIAIGYGIPERYPIGGDKDTYKKQYKKHHPDASNLVIAQQAGQMHRFCEEIKPGDYVITPSANSDILYYGKVLDEPYSFEPNDDCPFEHRRRVSWNSETASRSTFSVPFQNTTRSSLTVFRISKIDEFLTAIQAEEYEPPEAVPAYNPYDSVIEQILTLDATEFELLVDHLLVAIGFEETEVTGRPGDGGVDVVGTLNAFNLAKVKVHVQVKRYQQGSKISARTVQDLRSSIPHGEQGAFITTSDYQSAAHQIATEDRFSRIGLINGRQLVDLLVEHWKDIPDDFQDKLGLKIGLVLSG